MTYELHRDPRSSHQRIARYVRRLNRHPILDVGAGSGQLGRILADTGLVIDGVEPDAEAADAARPFYRSIMPARIEDAELPTATYEVVICADVLEHTTDPLAVLRHVVAASTTEAVFIISLPNVAHIAARLLLLAGTFPRHDRGIFDRTHLHFYTRATAVELVRDAGLVIGGISTTPVPLEEVWPPFLGTATREVAMRAQAYAARLSANLFAYQWLIVARRPPVAPA